MSIAETKHVFEAIEEGKSVDTPLNESDPEERDALERLTQTSPPTSGPIIAVDLDDVLSQTNQQVATWHNEAYGTNMTVDHFYYYYYWKNPFWGTVQETFKKVKAFYETPLIYQSQPVLGSREGIQALKDMGYRLIIVTARGPDTQDESWEWVNKNFPDCFESIICTGQFKDAHKEGHEVVTKLSKAEVCFDLGARLLIDDSSENAIQCATAHPNATRVLLFGNYEWNQRISGHEDYNDAMSYNIRLLAEAGREFWKEESFQIPDGAPLERVRDWAEVVRWIQKARLEDRM